MADEEDSSKVKVDFEYKGFEYRFSLNMLDFRNELLDIFGNLYVELYPRFRRRALSGHRAVRNT